MNKYLEKASAKICKHIVNGYILGTDAYSIIDFNATKITVTKRQVEYMVEMGYITYGGQTSPNSYFIGYKLSSLGKQMIRDYNLSKLID